VASKPHSKPKPWGELRSSSERQDQGWSWLGLPAQRDSAAPQGGHNIPKPVRRTWGRVNAAVVRLKIMSLPGGEKHRFEREGREPKPGFFVEQGCVTKKSACLSAVMGVVEQRRRRRVLTGQRCSAPPCASPLRGSREKSFPTIFSPEDENPARVPGKGPTAV